MMKKKTENKFGLVKQLLVLPLLAVLIMSLSAREVKTEYLPQQATETSATANLVIIVDGQVIPADSEKFSQFDFSKEFDGGKIIEALELDENEIEINGLSFNEEFE
jgi:bla regulator protein blaR1